jgi:signal transduction histidine kinase
VDRDAALQALLHERFVEMFLSQSRRAQLGLLGAALLVGWTWWQQTGGPWAAAWLLLAMAVCCWRLAATERFVRGGGPAQQLRRIVIVLLLNGLVMALPLLAFLQLSPLARAPQSIILLATATASVLTTLGYRSVFLCFAAPMLLPLAAAWFASGFVEDSAAGHGMGALTLFFGAFLLSAARQAEESFRESGRFRFGEQQANEQLRAALEAAGEANRAKTQFLAAASHDLRQPLHSMNALVAALSLRSLDERSAGIVRLLDQVNHTLSRQLDGLLDVSRLDAGLVRPELAPLALDEFLRQQHAALAPAAAELGIELRLHIERCGSVMSDAALLARVLGNLCDNALKFTPRGGCVTLALQDAGVEAGRAQLRLSVADTGIGIAPEEQPKVFREFYQVGNVERDRLKGLGLGLAIVSRLSKLLGLRLALHSVPGQGTRFELTLPALAGPSAAVAGAPVLRPQVAGQRVLLIDDEELVLQAMRCLLEELGCATVCVQDGEAALTALRATDFDLVLSDLRLREGASGALLLQRLRALRPGLRVALVTGDMAAERLQEAQAAGLPLLHKPLDLQQLLPLLKP